MHLTKYLHACFTVEKNNDVLIVDPGNFSTDFIAPENVAAVVVTHEHPDHFDHQHLEAIIDKNPEAIIIAHKSITQTLEAFPTLAVEPRQKVTVKSFDLEFFGGEHARIHTTIPLIANLGVLINELLYYPGDSFTVPEVPIDTLALPVAAPWTKASETIDYLVAIKPRLAFPTHDAILSEQGKALIDRLAGQYAEQYAIEYRRISDLTL